MFAIDHVQIAIPPGGEPAARAFFVGLLGMSEEEKPEALAARGGCWFRMGRVHLHCGVESPFQPQRKAHAAFLISDLDALVEKLAKAGSPIRWDETVAGRRRFYTDDPFGNRLEFISSGHGFSERLQPLLSKAEPTQDNVGPLASMKVVDDG
jgi:catechol 2,3-dioxygenase-like lactoylglutathione lyase family enzyme